ncbi:BPTD_3080 family restriction endonuclease [Actinomycetospora termitidis]|uniref:DEAD/DEAH box helicase family protein n=1 Tax=Actinomycetospora termitidis TaxID=3053470 RepID=A0ABT7M9Z2_9PSEU|nr:DEAD/DEAH box helicase family protein [Actinomycetospora sp. Odt1-22]MDL5157471.1 DEAD/DEAH box helicase family protein [Actinomycetospora sp. Odt1-22]
MARQAIENPILNRPYEQPARHWRFDDRGVILPEIEEGRRPSESWIPIPPPTKKKRSTAVQQEFDLAHTSERRLRNEQVDHIRTAVDRWRRQGYGDVTPTTKRLLEYWSDPERENKVLFCQREAIETAIFLAEAASKRDGQWVAGELAEINNRYNVGLPRVALKMATGSGKTIVMAALIAWQTLNKAARPHDARFARRFLVVTPGVTIRDRLRVLMPSDDENYYRARDLVPADLWPDLRSAQIVVTNFHSFLLRTTREGQQASATTRAYATTRVDVDPFVEKPDQMVSRVLREFSGSRQRGEIVVLNDEAHHCYQGRTVAAEDGQTEADLTGTEKSEAAGRNADAGVWFTGLQRVESKIGIKAVYDLSATPFFLKGSGYPEGFLFPWVVSDFSLMDAIESGIVKIPRVPVDDNASHDEVTYLNLWARIGDDLPKRLPRGGLAPGTALPHTLDAALHSLYGHYEDAYERWSRAADVEVEAPPVFIVVCNNTTVSKMVFDVIAGYTKNTDVGDVHVRGALPLFSNVEDGHPVRRPRTILVDSAQLESGGGISKDFKAAAADEIDAYRAEFAARTGRSSEEIDDTALLREVMNTVGKPGRLGGNVRCVVSVSMLTEGWDANTVTHVLGVRAFGSQLLCEQVVGRGLRRRSYAVNSDGYFDAEYAEVYGVPFSFVRVEPGEAPDPTPTRPPVPVRAMLDRGDLRITFPKLDGYRVEIPERPLDVTFTDAHRFTLDLASVPTLTETAGVVGRQAIHTLDELSRERTQRVAFSIAQRLVDRYFTDGLDEPRRWLFPQLVVLARRWLDECVEYRGTFPGLFMLSEMNHLAAERISHAVVGGGQGPETVLPIFRRFEPEGSSDDVDFTTTKVVYEAEPDRSPVNYVVLDGIGGNTWEQIVAQSLESLSSSVRSYVKNDHLELAIPYTHAGRSHRYLPDFLVDLVPAADGVRRSLLVEVSGTQKPKAMTQEKADTARNLWCAALNNHGGWGRWGFLEITEPATAKSELTQAIADLYADVDISSGVRRNRVPARSAS